MAFTKITAAGIGTTESVTLDGLSVINNGSFGGNLTVGGVLTYEDVTNVDSVGLITARNGIVVGSGITLSKDGDIFATGITTVSGNVKVGTGITISPDGDGFFTGVTTATTFVGALTGTASGNTTISNNADNRVITGGSGNALNGESGLTYDGSNLSVTGGFDASSDISLADTIKHTGDTNTKIRFPAADTFTVETGGSERIRVDSDGHFGIGMSPSGIRLDVQSSVNEVARFSGTNSGNITIRNDTNHELQLHTGTSDALIFGTNGENERARIDSSGRFLIAKGAASTTTSQIQIGDGVSGYTWDVGDVPQVLIAGVNNESPTSGTLNIALRVADENSNNMFQIHNRGGGNTDLGEIFMAGKVGIGTDTPYNQLAVVGSSADVMIYDTDAYSQNVSGGALGLAGNDSAGVRKTLADVRGVSNGSNLGEFAIRTRRSGGTLTEALRINSSGALILGASSPGGLASSRLFQIQAGSHSTVGMQILMTANDDNPASIDIGKSRSTGNAILGNNDDVGQINFFGNDGSGFHSMARIICSCQGHDTSNDDLPSKLVFQTLKENSTTLRSRLQIDDEGIISTNSENHGLNVSTTVSAGTDKYNFRGHHSGTAGSPGSGTISFTVWSNGNVQNTNNSYGQISDETLKQDIVDASSQWNDIKNITVRKFRFKENVVSISDGITRLKQLNPYRFNFKSASSTTLDGFYAHEASEVVPESVVGTKDAVDSEGNIDPQGIDQSKIVPLLTAALQEAVTKIEVLETRLNNAGIAT